METTADTPLTCAHCEPLLIEFVHEELEQVTHVGVAQHLASCSACALASCRLRADLEGIAVVVNERPRAQVRTQLRARVASEFTKTPTLVDHFRRLWSRPIPAWQALGLAAAPAVVLTLVWWGPAMNPSPDSQPSTDHAPEIDRVDAGGPLRDLRLL